MHSCSVPTIIIHYAHTRTVSTRRHGTAAVLTKKVANSCHDHKESKKTQLIFDTSNLLYNYIMSLFILFYTR